MVQIKICGFTRRQDIDDALLLGIKIIGINFYRGSPRYVSPKSAGVLLKNLPEDIVPIGVFVNPDEKTVFDALSYLGISGVQLHGDEPPSLINKIKKGFPDSIIIKALRVKNRKSLMEGTKKYKVDFFLLDAYKKGVPGGTGIEIDSASLNEPGLPWNKIFLAGGITPENAAVLVKKFNPYGIDVASGVELAPGIKDKEKIRRLVENINEQKDT
jgi:phosphoribosylanthranilate isomerase